MASRSDVTKNSIECVSYDDVEDLIDDIEYRVNDALDLLQSCNEDDISDVVKTLKDCIDVLQDLSNDLR